MGPQAVAAVEVHAVRWVLEHRDLRCATSPLGCRGCGYLGTTFLDVRLKIRSSKHFCRSCEKVPPLQIHEREVQVASEKTEMAGDLCLKAKKTETTVCFFILLSKCQCLPKATDSKLYPLTGSLTKCHLE